MFRHWINQLWYEHCREVLSWTKKPVDYPPKVWFNRNKWYLKRLFKKGEK